MSSSPLDLCTDRRRGRNSQNAGRTAVPSGKNADTSREVPHILLHGHYWILCTLASNSRLTLVPESNLSAKNIQTAPHSRGFTPDRAGGWDHRARQRKWVNEWRVKELEVNAHESGRVRQEKLCTLSWLGRITLSDSQEAVTGGATLSLVPLLSLLPMFSCQPPPPPPVQQQDPQGPTSVLSLDEVKQRKPGWLCHAARRRCVKWQETDHNPTLMKSCLWHEQGDLIYWCVSPGGNGGQDSSCRAPDTPASHTWSRQRKAGTTQESCVTSLSYTKTGQVLWYKTDRV